VKWLTDCKTLYERVLDELSDPNGRQFASATRQVMAALNSEKDKLAEALAELVGSAMRRVDENSVTVADQLLYDLPGDFLRMWELGLVDAAGTYAKLYTFLDRDREAQLLSGETKFRLIGSQVELVPAPATAGQTIRYEYSACPADFCYGTASAGTATTITLAATATAGETVLADDYYNGAWIRIMSGTGAGQIREITDFAAGTLLATVAAWDTNPDATSVYAICSPFPKDLNRLLIAGAVIRLGRSKNIIDVGLWRDEYNRDYEDALYRFGRRDSSDKPRVDAHDYVRLFPG